MFWVTAQVYYGNYLGGRCCLKRMKVDKDKLTYTVKIGLDQYAPYGTYTRLATGGLQ